MLPVNTSPTYNLVVPSTKETVKYRPFLVREEKALMLAQQSEDQDVMVDTLKGIIASCVLSKIDVDKLATFDIEYIFTQIRAKSVGEISQIVFKCDQCEGNDKAVVQVNIDLTQLAVDFPEGHTKKIPLFGEVGVMMKYPTFDVIKQAQHVDKNDVNSAFQLIIDCIDYIYTADEIHKPEDYSKQELRDFLENLTSEQFNSIQTFFNTMPKIRKNVEYDCPECGKHHKAVVEGIESFF